MGLERDFIHFLKNKCFILENVRDRALNARAHSNNVEMAGELVMWIKNRVKLDPQAYHTLVHHFRHVGKLYQPIVDTLEAEYKRQGKRFSYYSNNTK